MSTWTGLVVEKPASGPVLNVQTPCRNGHLSDRYKNGECKACSKAKVASWRERNREKWLASMAKAHRRRTTISWREHVLLVPVSP